jgi:hypothetical protein
VVRVQIMGDARTLDTGGNYWLISVEAASNPAGAVARKGTPFSTLDEGFRAQVWKTLLEDVGVFKDYTLFVRFTKLGTAPNLVNISLTYGLEVR